MTNRTLEYVFEKKRQSHKRNANIPFEEKIRQIIELQKIDTEFNKQRKTPRASYMRIWPSVTVDTPHAIDKK